VAGITVLLLYQVNKDDVPGIGDEADELRRPRHLEGEIDKNTPKVRMQLI
jgi:hypothetical protein